MNIKFDRVTATELKNGKYRFHAIEADGTAHLIRKAGNLTKGVVQWSITQERPAKDYFGYNVADAAAMPERVERIYYPGNGIEVIPYAA